MKTWGRGMWLLFAGEVVLVVSILYILGHAYIEVGILKYYAVWGSALVSYFAWNTHRRQPCELHIHHYVVALVLMSFNSYQSPYASAVHAFCHGFFVEGGCRWGFDAIWETSNGLEKKNNILLNHKQSEVRKLRQSFVAVDDDKEVGTPVVAMPVVQQPNLYGSFVML